VSANATRLVLLGTAGGPLPSPVRSGIAQAIVVGGRVYLVDCGSGVTRQLRRTRLLRHLHEVFLTHMHSDHDCDLFNLFLLGWPILQWNPPVVVHGPGSAGALPPAPPDLPPGRLLPVVHPANPTPGLSDLLRAQFEAHAYDINVRTRQAGRLDLTSLVVADEVALAPALGAGPTAVAPAMDPFLVAEDDRVRVTAVLVEHAPVFPSFAFRFETDDGSIVISGDTAPCANLVTLARGADILVHEVYDDGRAREDDDDWEARQRERHLVTSHTALSRLGAVAAEAQVRRLVLTHFIPGDDVLPDAYWLDGIGDAFDGEVIVGHDELELRP
jgi:ribonuclease BN (tRNA processing enzyme)